jgi:L-malate glycosyltransferase
VKTEKKRKNIVIITPFYPILHRKDLNGDTKAIHYLIKSFSYNNNVLVIHSFIHRFKSTYKNILRVLTLGNHYKNFEYEDSYRNKVLFFENFLFFPKIDKIVNFFNEKYSKLFNDFCASENFIPDVGVIHFPTYYKGFLEHTETFPKKIAILHSVDIKKIKKNNQYWMNYFNTFDAIGFRSYVIKEAFEKLVKYENRTFLCLSGIPKEFLDVELRKKTYSKNTKINLMYAGKIDENKNLDKTVRSLHKLSKDFDFTFNIIGDGVKRKAVEELANHLKLRKSINFLGNMKRESVIQYMRTNDIFVMISKKETLGLVYLEAMASGCIVIGTKGQGIDGIIRDGENGFLSSSNDPKNIYETIKKVMELSEKEQIRIKFNAKNTVEKMSDIEMSNVYFDNICSVIDENTEEY